ncbi:hypothetical protein KC340_g76 [Hortaea werneckii]|nr:hypothetical protein KC340_g76 [Hortaea werneckii]
MATHCVQGPVNERLAERAKPASTGCAPPNICVARCLTLLLLQNLPKAVGRIPKLHTYLACGPPCRAVPFGVNSGEKLVIYALPGSNS